MPALVAVGGRGGELLEQKSKIASSITLAPWNQSMPIQLNASKHQLLASYIKNFQNWDTNTMF